MLFVEFMSKLVKFGLEYFGLFYGVYRGEVVNNDDPDGLGRVVVKVPSVMHRAEEASENWAWPIMPAAAKDYGVFFPPAKGDTVWVMFENGRPEYPIYVGGWWGKDELAEEWQSSGSSGDKEFVRGIKSKAGHEVRFDDRSGSEKVVLKHKNNAHLSLMTDGSFIIATPGGHLIFANNNDGELLIVNNDGSCLTITDSGIIAADKSGSGLLQVSESVQLMGSDITLAAGSVTISTGGVSLGGATAIEPAVLGNRLVAVLTQLATALATHTHTSAASGSPTSPPVPPPPMPPISTILSQAVKLK